VAWVWLTSGFSVCKVAERHIAALKGNFANHAVTIALLLSCHEYRRPGLSLALSGLPNTFALWKKMFIFLSEDGWF
jgi:hypothetical protein